MKSPSHNPPPVRRLRVYAFDPSLATRLETAQVNEIVLHLPWEVEPTTGESIVAPGPVGEYIEVVDYDPASGSFYAPVDLNNPELLAQDGLTPSVADPGFHQQMVYAVSMTTIGHFERALGRVMLWAPHIVRDEDGGFVREEYVQRLRVYPHALREANAYYSPRKKSLLFGYFPISSDDPDNVPGSLVFTCLSHDIVTHETTHALLDGLHPRFSESTNLDVLALHEAFSDIVAIFQHFANPEVLRHQISRTRGNLEGQNMLGQLAQEFGRAIGRGTALRDALGGVDDEGNWQRRQPDARRLERALAPHARGSIFVAAVFDAFLLIYKHRVADLLRIGTGGTGVLAPGEIHPDLVNRMADEAAKSARHILHMCIRALDCCPPVDVTFGDFLRAIITADSDLNPEDLHGYRVAVLESFRQHGIAPGGIRSMSSDALLWPSGSEALLDESATVSTEATVEPISEERSKQNRMAIQAAVGVMFDEPALRNRKSAAGNSELTEAIDEVDSSAGGLALDWNLQTDRRRAWESISSNGAILHRWLTEGGGREYANAFGLELDEGAPPSVYRDRGGKRPAVEVHSVRTAFRRGSKGSQLTDLVVEITQRRRGYFDRERQAKIDSGYEKITAGDRGDFRFRRGCTILIDPTTMDVRRVIRTPGTVSDNKELERVRAFITREDPPPGNAFDADAYIGSSQGEDFAHVHRLHAIE